MTTKRISAELTDDNAIKLDILYTTTRLNNEPKKEADRMFCEIATLAVEKAIEACRRATGAQYPSYTQLLEYLDGI